MSSRLIHVLACVIVSFLFKAEQLCLSIRLLMDMQAAFTFCYCQYCCSEHTHPQAHCVDMGQRLAQRVPARASTPAGVLWLSLYSLALILLLSGMVGPVFHGDEGLAGEAEYLTVADFANTWASLGRRGA